MLGWHALVLREMRMGVSCVDASYEPLSLSSFVFLYFLTSQHYTTHTHIPHAFLFFSWFSVFFHTHTHARTHTRAIDCDLESGLIKSVCVNTWKNREICLKKTKSGESLAKARFDIDGQIVRLRRSGERLIEPSGSWFSPKFPSFFTKKRMIRGLGHALFWTCSQTLNGHDPVLTSGEPIEQVTTLRGPFVVSAKMAMRHEPNIVSRRCSR